MKAQPVELSLLDLSEEDLPDIDGAAAMTELAEAISSLASERTEIRDRAGGQDSGTSVLKPLSSSRMATPTLSEATIVSSVAAPPMAPGLGGFNIDSPRPRTVLAGYRRKPAQPRLLRDLDIIPPSPIERERDFSTVWLVAPILCLLAIGAIFGLKVLAPDGSPQRLSELAQTAAPAQASKASKSTTTARIVVFNQKGLVNEPLPVGVSLRNATGGESVTVTGLADSVELSFGTSLGSQGWFLTADDLGRAFVGPPKDFIGVMDATVHLRSADDALLDTRTMRFEWMQTPKPGGRDITAFADRSRPIPSNASGDARLMTKLAEELLQHGEVGAARLVLKRAAEAGHAQAALVLGMTYDEPFLAQWGDLNVNPDPGSAREWYDRAIKLGSAEASRRLQLLAPPSDRPK